MVSRVAKNMKILFLRTDGQFAVNLRNLHILEHLRSRYTVDERVIPKEKLFNIRPLRLSHLLKPSNLKTIIEKLFIDEDLSIYREYAMNQFIENVDKVIQKESAEIALRVKDFDYMHASDIFTGYIACNVNRMIGVPYVFDLHDIYHEIFRAYNSHPEKIRLYDHMEKETVGAAKHIICVSGLARTHLSHLYGVPLEKISVVPNGTEDTGLTAAFYNPFRVVYAGNLHNIERVIDFIKTRELLPDENIEFYLMGDGEERERYLNYINENRLDVIYLGLKTWHKAMREYSKMQAGVVPGMDCLGRRACCPMKVMDYAVCGLPVIMPELYEFSKYIKKYDAGILTKGSSPQEFKDAIEELQDEDVWARKSKNAHRMALQEFLWKDVLKGLDALYG
jgi:glycosyltransferase involved in cell wall biosynthesis